MDRIVCERNHMFSIRSLCADTINNNYVHLCVLELNVWLYGSGVRVVHRIQAFNVVFKKQTFRTLNWLFVEWLLLCIIFIYYSCLRFHTHNTYEWRRPKEILHPPPSWATLVHNNGVIKMKWLTIIIPNLPAAKSYSSPRNTIHYWRRRKKKHVNDKWSPCDSRLGRNGCYAATYLSNRQTNYCLLFSGSSKSIRRLNVCFDSFDVVRR